MRFTAGERVVFEAAEVGDVHSDERAAFGDRNGEELFVRRIFEPSVLRIVHGNDVMTARAVAQRDYRRRRELKRSS